MATGGTKKELKASVREALGQKDYEQALARSLELIELDDSSYDAHLYAGKAAFHMGDVPRSLAAYSTAARLNPNGLPAWQGLAEVHTAQEEHAEAAQALERVVALYPSVAAPGQDPQLFITLQKRLAAAYEADGQCEAAYGLWQGLASTATEANAEDARLEAMCHMADAAMTREGEELEAAVLEETEEARAAGAQVEDSVIRRRVESTWCYDGLQGDNYEVLREITTMTAPTPEYARYHEAYLERCRKAVQSMVPGSLDRLECRAYALYQCRKMVGGLGPSGPGGCCTPRPFITALRLMEIEAEVVGNCRRRASMDRSSSGVERRHSLSERSPRGSFTGVRDAEAQEAATGQLLQEFHHVSKRLIHSFPWLPGAAVQRALALARAAPLQTEAHSTRRRQVIDTLIAATPESCTDSGDIPVARYICLARLLVVEGRAEEAIRYAQEGLADIAGRRARDSERLEQVDLTLRVLLGNAQLKAGLLDEAEATFRAEDAVSAGSCTFSRMAGLRCMNIRSEACRGLARVALARGDPAKARYLYEKLLGKAYIGHTNAEHWAHAEYGWLLHVFKNDVDAAKQLRIAIQEAEMSGAPQEEVTRHERTLSEIEGGPPPS